ATRPDRRSAPRREPPIRPSSRPSLPISRIRFYWLGRDGADGMEELLRSLSWRLQRLDLPRVAPPRPRRVTPDSLRMRWMNPYDRPVEAARARMDSPAA